jgi:hypothetical protein
MTRTARIALAFATALCAAAIGVAGHSPSPAAAVGPTFFKAINFNGPSLVVDGVTFEAEATSGATVGPLTQRFCADSLPLISPPATAEEQQLVRCAVWGTDDTGGLDASVPVPAGEYQLTMWTVEDNFQENVGFLVNGAPFAEIDTGPPGTWRRIGPLPVIITDGTLHLGSRFGAANVSAIRLDTIEIANGYIPLNTPARILETRPGLPTTDGSFDAVGVRLAGSVLELEVGGRVGVPVGAASVAVNVTVTESTGDGHITVFPCGVAQPTASNLNYVAGQTVANMVISRLGTSGRICLYTFAQTQLVVDVSGYFASPTSFNALSSPQRLLDTRPGFTTADGLFAGTGLRPEGTVLELDVAGRVGVIPGANAVALNITAAGPARAGYVTAYPCGSAVPATSSVNFGAGETFANMAITKLGTGGKVCLFTFVPMHLIVDVSGYFTDTATFVPVVTPQRMLDTRPGFATDDGLFAGIGHRPAGSILELQVAGRLGVAADAVTAALNVTATNGGRPGYITVYPCGAAFPDSSNVNYVAATGVANAVFAKIGAGGKVCLYTFSDADIVVDVSGTLNL